MVKHIVRLAVLLTVWIETSTAFTKLPCGGEIWLLDRAFEATVPEWSRAAALTTLENIAEGKPKTMIVASALRAGLRVFAQYDVSFEYTCSRAHALERIGATDLPEAIEYLHSLTPADIRPDETQTLYPTSQLAERKAVLRRQSSPETQLEFLQDQLTSPPVPIVANWAMEELCNRGSSRSLPQIVQLVRRQHADELRANEEINFCRDRMEIVNRASNRVEALASALSIEQILLEKNLKITTWALRQLQFIHTEESNAVLTLYLRNIDRALSHFEPNTSNRDARVLRTMAEETRTALGLR